MLEGRPPLHGSQQVARGNALDLAQPHVPSADRCRSECLDLRDDGELPSTPKNVLLGRWLNVNLLITKRVKRKGLFKEGHVRLACRIEYFGVSGSLSVVSTFNCCGHSVARSGACQ